jgi:hypothetical protein
MMPPGSIRVRCALLDSGESTATAAAAATVTGTLMRMLRGNAAAYPYPGTLRAAWWRWPQSTATTRTSRTFLPFAAVRAASWSERGLPGVDLEGSLGDFPCEAGSSVRMARVLTEPCPLPTICSRAARRAAEGIGEVSAATEPICSQVSCWASSRRAGDDRAEGVGCGLAPQVVTVGASAPWCSSPVSELRITRVFSCVARRLRAHYWAAPSRTITEGAHIMPDTAHRSHGCRPACRWRHRCPFPSRRSSRLQLPDRSWRRRGRSGPGNGGGVLSPIHSRVSLMSGRVRTSCGSARHRTVARKARNASGS